MSLFFSADGFAADKFDSETGYRISHYRAPTPDTVPGGTKIDLNGLRKLIEQKRPILVDVMFVRGLQVEELTGDWLIPTPRENIPGSIWLPNVGNGTLAPDMERYFREGLRKLTERSKNAVLVFYCLADCWMSWNAAKRAASWGYTNVYWFPEGTDDWVAAGLPLEDAKTLPPTPTDSADGNVANGH